MILAQPSEIPEWRPLRLLLGCLSNFKEMAACKSGSASFFVGGRYLLCTVIKPTQQRRCFFKRRELQLNHLCASYTHAHFQLIPGHFKRCAPLLYVSRGFIWMFCIQTTSYFPRSFFSFFWLWLLTFLLDKPNTLLDHVNVDTALWECAHTTVQAMSQCALWRKFKCLRVANLVCKLWISRQRLGYPEKNQWLTSHDAHVSFSWNFCTSHGKGIKTYAEEYDESISLSCMSFFNRLLCKLLLPSSSCSACLVGERVIATSVTQRFCLYFRPYSTNDRYRLQLVEGTSCDVPRLRRSVF